MPSQKLLLTEGPWHNRDTISIRHPGDNPGPSSLTTEQSYCWNWRSSSVPCLVTNTNPSYLSVVSPVEQAVFSVEFLGHCGPVDLHTGSIDDKVIPLTHCLQKVVDVRPFVNKETNRMTVYCHLKPNKNGGSPAKISLTLPLFCQCCFTFYYLTNPQSPRFVQSGSKNYLRRSPWLNSQECGSI